MLPGRGICERLGHTVTFALLIGELLLSPVIILLANVPSFLNFRVNQFQGKRLTKRNLNYWFNSCYVSSRNLSPVLTKILARSNFLIRTAAKHL